MRSFRRIVRNAQRATGSLLASILLASAGFGQSPSPNVLYIIADDWGAMDLGAAGSALYETPNIDALAQGGMQFSRAYQVFPRCVPSRFGMMTGQNPARDGWRLGGHMSLDHVTIGEAFRDAGYDTLYVGKWHLGEEEDGKVPAAQGFATSIAAGGAGAPRSYFAPYNQGDHGKEKAIPDLDDAPPGEYLTDRLTEETIDWLRRDREQPFFAVLAHYAVHTPIQGKAHYTARYEEKLNGQIYTGDLPEMVYDQAGETKLRQDNAEYAAMVQSLDESVGRLMETLEALDLAEETIVVLTSDHGGLSSRGRGNKRPLATSNSPLRAGKGHLYEGGVRVPMIVSWPGKIAAGTSSDATVSGPDLYPTLLELSGHNARPEQHLDAVSFAPLLRGDEHPARGPLYWHNPKARPTSTGDINASAILSGDYKLHWFYEFNRVELYNIADDPGETNNLADDLPAKREQLLAELQQYLREADAWTEKTPIKYKAITWTQEPVPN